jgi:hypothetical protein
LDILEAYPASRDIASLVAFEDCWRSAEVLVESGVVTVEGGMVVGDLQVHRKSGSCAVGIAEVVEQPTSDLAGRRRMDLSDPSRLECATGWVIYQSSVLFALRFAAFLS